MKKSVPSRKSLGFMTNKTYEYNQIREDIANKKNRQHKISIQEASDTGKESLINSNTSDTVSIELNSKYQLPAQWVDYYRRTLNLIEEIKKQIPELQKVIRERFQNQFGDTASIDKKIQEKTISIMSKLRDCERNLAFIDEKASLMSETESEKKVRENSKRNLAIQIQELMFSMRQLQKNYYGQVKKMQSVEQKLPLEQIAPIIDDQDEDDGGNLDELILQQHQSRNKEITKLVDTINELSQMFKQLSQLVFDQGTLLDRIDFNIEQTHAHVKKGNKHLEEALKHQESPLAQKCIKILVGLIVFFLIILIIKYSG